MTWAEVGREDGLRRVEGSWEEVEELRPKSRWETLKKVRRGEKSWGWRGKWWKNWGRTVGKSCEKKKKNWDDLRRVATGLEVVATTEKSAPRRKRISRIELRRCESSLHFIRFGSYHIPLFPAGKFPNPPRAGFNCIAAVCDTCCHAKSKLTGSYSLRPAITDTKRSGQHVPMFKSPFGSSNLQWGCMEPDLFLFLSRALWHHEGPPTRVAFLVANHGEKKENWWERAAGDGVSTTCRFWPATFRSMVLFRVFFFIRVWCCVFTGFVSFWRLHAYNPLLSKIIRILLITDHAIGSE